MQIQSGKKLLFIGDSITDCGRAQPVGEGLFSPYGNGYVNVIVGLMGALYADRNIRIVNMGLSGNTVRDLEARWERDVTALAPDWLSVMIGINDVWRQFDVPLQSEAGVDPDSYRQTLQRLVEASKPKLDGLVLMTPFYIEPNRSDAMRARMDEYGAIVKDLAAATGAVFVNTQTALDQALEHYYPATLAWDRVHPSIVGHTVLAKAWLDAIGFAWS